MPGYIIHLVEAEIVIEKLLKCDRREEYPEEWQQKFRWGCLIPDAAPKENGKRSEVHFREQTQMTKPEVKLPDIEKFVKRKRKSLYKIEKNPELFGYYAHLYLDRLFFDVYLRSRLEMFDSRGLPTRSFEKAVEFRVVGTDRKIESEELLKDLYDDYTKLNRYLSNKYSISIPDTVSGKVCRFKQRKVKELNGLAIDDVLEKLSEFWKKEEEETQEIINDRNLKIIEINSLEQFLVYASNTMLESVKKGINDIYLAAWSEKWNCEKSEDKLDFPCIFIYTYLNTYGLYLKNKARNFQFKILFIVVMSLALFAGVILWGINLYRGGSLSYIIAENSFLTVAIALLLTIISKWIDVKKYQETWCRHYFHLYMLRREIFRYIYGLQGYGEESGKSDKDIKRLFIKRFLKIEDVNTEKFVSNMETKEIRIGEKIRDIF